MVKKEPMEIIEFASSGKQVFAIKKINLEERKKQDWLTSKDKFRAHSISISEIALEKLKPKDLKEDFFFYSIFSLNGEYALLEFADNTIPSLQLYNHQIITLVNTDFKKLWFKEFVIKELNENVHFNFLGMENLFAIKTKSTVYIYDLSKN